MARRRRRWRRRKRSRDSSPRRHGEEQVLVFLRDSLTPWWVRVSQTMTANSKIWVSELNARPEVRGAFPQTAVRFYDTTLRDGEQTVGVVLSPQQKVEIEIGR